MSLWSNILFNCVVVINIIVAFFYPFDNTVPGKFRVSFTIYFLIDFLLKAMIVLYFFNDCPRFLHRP